ncbi:hypothetical protein [Bacillus sp. FJAT-29814]|uniref:hypothetical protein n=1 Tax=Bacillus sp. FJAT-29814 TaxID=1729688 RepID=UPI000A5896FC|nr:hypothetical protein [Bacillus sp. FJAT-29814]
MSSIMGLFSLFIVTGVPVAIIFLLVLIYQIKKNSEIQIEQNKKIIQLLEKSH